MSFSEKKLYHHSALHSTLLELLSSSAFVNEAPVAAATAAAWRQTMNEEWAHSACDLECRPGRLPGRYDISVAWVCARLHVCVHNRLGHVWGLLTPVVLHHYCLRSNDVSYLWGVPAETVRNTERRDEESEHPLHLRLAVLKASRLPLFTDVIGVCKSADDVSRITTRSSREVSKRTLYLVDTTGKNVAVTLWGEEVITLESFLCSFFVRQLTVDCFLSRVACRNEESLCGTCSHTIQPFVRQSIVQNVFVLILWFITFSWYQLF